MMADRGGNKMMVAEPGSLEEWKSLVSRLLRCTNPGSRIWLQDHVPMETTGSQQCGTETEHLSRFWLCSSVSSWVPFLFSLLTYSKMTVELKLKFVKSIGLY